MDQANHFDVAGGRVFLSMSSAKSCDLVELHEGVVAELGSHPEAALQIEGVPDQVARILWEGNTIRVDALTEDLYVNGKSTNGAYLRPGDELSVGKSHMVVGVATNDTGGIRRRALTHDEFRERLWEELSRATRAGRTLVVAMVNVRLGEGARFASAALKRCRSGDLVATYAPDQLELLLPDTTPTQAEKVVEQIFELAGARGHYGLSSAPHDGLHAERVIRGARDALARAVLEGTRFATPALGMLRPLLAFDEDPTTERMSEEFETASRSNGSVMLVGEVGVGKRMAARRIHDMSAPDGPLVYVRCGVVDLQTLEESFQSAKAGTVFLDSVGHLQPDAQAKVLTLLKGFRGRVIAASSQSLKTRAERGSFSEELVTALSKTTLDLPALRERPRDILSLALRFARQFGYNHPTMSAHAVARLRSHAWPSNVLELKNAVERAVALAQGTQLRAEHLPSASQPSSTSASQLRDHVDTVERDAIVRALADTNHNQTHAAKKLGISRRALIYKMEKYGLKPPPRSGRRRTPV